tara:strand:- start:413 stop:1588 length:1176 start_codon:yes stop_codon:yes gene_type:complete
MVLPLLGSFLGSAFLPGLAAKTGLAFLANPVAAGAIGSGIGSLLQGDSLDEAIGTGLTSYFGGKLLGGLQKPVDTTALSGPVGGGMLTDPKALGAEGLASKLTVPSNPVNILDAGKAGIGQGLKQGLGTIMANPLAAAGTAGGAMFASAANQQGEDMNAPSNYKRSETVPIQQNVNTPFAGYRAGIDPQFNYGFRNPSAGELQTRFLNQGGMADYVNPTMLSKGGIATFAEGGDVVEAEQSQMSMLDANEKDIIINAVNAIKGNMPEREASIALAMFVEKFGEEALEDLVEDVKKGEYDNISGKADGMIKGGGDGMSDSVPATIDGKQDLLVSKDEYVVDAPTVAMIGNGSSAAGAEKLDKMREEVRKAATGSRIQPKEIDAEEIMGKAIA